MKNFHDSDREVAVSQPFRLQRENTLLPSEFREHMSARQKNRKTSATKSVSHGQKSRVKSSSELSIQGNGFQTDLDSSHDNMSGMLQNSAEYDPSRFSYLYQNTTSEEPEMKSKSTHIALNEDFKFMMDNAYANYEGGGTYAIKTPPSNMQIGDLMTPLDEWSANSIREKKYTVLPSIKSPQSEANHSSSVPSRLSVSSQNNQLDFTRDKIEREADFFADYRVNTSRVKPTPRQDPLPPIRLVEITKTHSASSRKSGLSSRLQNKSSEKHMMHS